MFSGNGGFYSARRRVISEIEDWALSLPDPAFGEEPQEKLMPGREESRIRKAIERALPRWINWEHIPYVTTRRRTSIDTLLLRVDRSRFVTYLAKNGWGPEVTGSELAREVQEHLRSKGG